MLYTRRPEVLRAAFAPAETPAYLTLSDSADVNYMDFGVPMGRRFRALKLWMVMEHYGIERMRAVIRDHVAWAKKLADEIERRDDYELLAPHMFSLVVFRKVVRGDEAASEAATQRVLDAINASGAYVSATRLGGKYGIRVAIGNGATEWRHVEEIISFL